jgi:ABC-type cobalamin transport system ATPase subunit
MSEITEIGVAAGKIWHFLDKNGASSTTKVSTETGLLAKEDKLAVELKGRVETLSLK